MRVYTLSVYRFDPSRDGRPHADTHVLESAHAPTVLEALRIVRRERDPGLAFRESCGLGKCGSCAVRLNQKPVLACQTRLEEGESRVEPLAGFPVVRDLVVDRSIVQERLKRSRAFFSRPDYLKEEETPFTWEERYRRLTECIECLICDSTCPSLRRNDSRFQGPLAYGQMARAITHPLDRGGQETVAWTDGVHNCTACMTCEYVCPKQMDVFRNGVTALRSRIVEKELSLPSTQQMLLDLYARTGKSVPPRATKLEHPAVDPHSRTALFFGCMFGDRYPEQGGKTLDLLAASGLRVRVPEGLVCCGGPLLWIGQRKLADQAMETNLGILISAGVERVITPCAGCGLTLKNDYRAAWRRSTGKDLPFEVVDFMELLGRRPGRLGLAAGAGSNAARPVRVAYHSPCHHGRSQNLLSQSVELLKACPGVEWVEHGAVEECCGGITALSNRPLMVEMSQGIVREVEQAGAEVLLTSCIFCRDNIHQAARLRRSPVKVMHSLHFLAEHAG